VLAVASDPITLLLVAVTALALLLLVVRALRTPYLARVGLRNALRRRGRALLIIFGLMLATTFVSAALTIDNTIVLAVQNVAVYSIGRVDEEVIGGSGPLGLYPESYAAKVRQTVDGDARVAGVASALELSDLLIVDETTRQVRGDVVGVALGSDATGPLADMRSVPGRSAAKIEALGDDEVYLNRAVARLLNANPGDTLSLYSTRWPGHQFRFVVRDLVSGGPLAERPSLVLPLPTVQTLLGAPSAINRVYVANAGDGLSGVGFSDDVADRLRAGLPNDVHARKIKQEGVRYALQAQDIFGRILTLYTLFALSIGLLLIFLIFALLASERRVELGMARAVGMRREQVVEMLLYEGAAYDMAAGLPGMLAGLGLGVLIIALVGPSIARLGFPVQLDVEPRSLLIAYCLGLVFTLAMIILAAWAVSRVTVAAALRGLPEPPPSPPPLRMLARRALAALTRIVRAPDQALRAWLSLSRALVVRGLVPLALGILTLRWAVEAHNGIGFSLGISVTLAGGALMLRWLSLLVGNLSARRLSPSIRLIAIERYSQVVDRFTALFLGLGLVLYWSLPFDALERVGLPRFSGGTEIIFAASVMMVFGAVLAITPNLDLLLAPLRRLAEYFGRARHVAFIALIYPSYQRLRTGIALSMFSLVCFTMVVMACIAESTAQRYGNLPAQAAGYDIVAQPLFTSVGGVNQAMDAIRRNEPATADDIRAVSAATPLPLIMLQPGAQQARWALYPASTISGAFLDGAGLPLVARAEGFTSDEAVWEAVRNAPGDVVIDAGALSKDDASALGVKPPAAVSLEQFVAPPIASSLLGISSLEALLGRSAVFEAQNRVPKDVQTVLSDPQKLHDYTLQLQGVATKSGTMTPTPLWIADPRGGAPLKVTVIGVVDNSQAERYGLLGAPQTFASVEQGLAPFSNEYYFFSLRPGADARGDARAISSALLDHGFETTVIQDALEDVNAPRVFASHVLLGLVALTLLIGMAALAVSGSRSVVERRQQIGMLRALGFKRPHVYLLFLLEALLVAGAGTAIGLALGLVLCRNVFAVDFFEQFQVGIALVIPWGVLLVMCGAAVAAALLAAVVPAWQASQVVPADALRYE
jgi:putative ABC transport system permease protein